MSNNGYQPQSPEDAAVEEGTASEDAARQAAITGEVHLSPRWQARNTLIYSSLVSLVYLAAPVLYVGFTQAAFCEKLGATRTVSNLPSAAYLLMSPFPVIIAWLVPQTRRLKISLSIGYLTTAAMGAIVTFAILLPGSIWDSLRIASLIAHAVVLGCANGVVSAFNWEALARGVSESRRGKAFALAFGVGPMFAVVGSLGSQLILTNKVFGWQPPLWQPISYPYNFALLFGASTPIMALAAYLAHLYVIPVPKVDAERKPFVPAVFGGFSRFLGYRLILIACVSYLLLYAAHTVQNNMVLYTEEVVDLPAEALVGYQNALRFSAKVLAGLLLGWVLIRTSPRTCMALTALLDMAGVLWILFARGMSFLFAFALSGAGELFGVYYPNYVVCCSPKSQIRRNMAFVKLIQTPVGLSPAFLGWIADRWGLRTSFWVALGVMGGTLVLIRTMLSPHPHPRPEDLEAADLENQALTQEQT